MIEGLSKWLFFFPCYAPTWLLYSKIYDNITRGGFFRLKGASEVLVRVGRQTLWIP